MVARFLLNDALPASAAQLLVEGHPLVQVKVASRFTDAMLVDILLDLSLHGRTFEHVVELAFVVNVVLVDPIGLVRKLSLCLLLLFESLDVLGLAAENVPG